MNDTSLRIPQSGRQAHRVFRLHGRPLISVVAPLSNTSGDIVAYLEGVFAVSGTAMSAARLLDLFAKIAPDLYRRLANRDDRQLKDLLGDIAHTYFMDDMDTILARDVAMER